MKEKRWDYREAYGSKDQLHAIGALITAWNNVELAMFFMYVTLLKADKDKVSPIFADHSNSSRLKLIRTLTEQKEHVHVIERVNMFCKHANICVANRNLIAHARIHNEDGEIIVTKIASGTQLHTEYGFSLEQIRKSADQTRETYAFGINLNSFMEAGVKLNDFSEGTERARVRMNAQVPSRGYIQLMSILPEAPAQPESLTHPPRKKSENNSRQPKPWNQ